MLGVCRDCLLHATLIAHFAELPGDGLLYRLGRAPRTQRFFHPGPSRNHRSRPFTYSGFPAHKPARYVSFLAPDRATEIRLRANGRTSIENHDGVMRLIDPPQNTGRTVWYAEIPFKGGVVLLPHCRRQHLPQPAAARRAGGGAADRPIGANRRPTRTRLQSVRIVGEADAVDPADSRSAWAAHHGQRFLTASRTGVCTSMGAFRI